MKGKLRALNPGNQKRKWNDRGTSSESMAQKKLVATPTKSRQVALTKPFAKCGWTDYTTAECRVGTNKCMWCVPRSFDCHLPLKTEGDKKGVARPIPLLCQGILPTRPTTVGRSYVMNKKEATISSTVVAGFLCFLKKNSKPFRVCLIRVLFIHLYPPKLYCY